MSITLPYDINNGDALDADKLMANENAIVSEYNAKVGAKAGEPVSTAETQTLTNKTLTTPIINGGTIDAPIIKPVAGAAPTVAGTLGFNDTTKQLVYGNGTAAIPVGQQYRAFTWYLDGTSIVADEVGAKYICPQIMTVSKIMAKTVSGTATIRLQKGTTDIDAGISVTSSVASETSISTPSLAVGDILTLDITAASSCVGLCVIVECLM